MARELTADQANKLLCPILSRADHRINCCVIHCMGWEWSSPLPQRETLRQVGNAANVADLTTFFGETGWRVDAGFIAEFCEPNGDIRRNGPGVSKIGHVNDYTLVKITKPWDETRLGSCALCAAKVAEVDVSN